MLTFGGRRIYLVAGAVDMGKSFNGLSGVVRDRLDADPMSRHLFFFCNRHRNRLKVLVADESGMWVLSKRLDRGRVVIGELGRHNLWAASRRVRGWLGSPTWRAAHFWTRGELRRHLSDAGLAVEAARGAIHYPPCACAARLLTPVDPWLSRAHAPGAAFLAVSAIKPSVTA